jgi:tetratricopeptide (TPR) repeat protein
MALALVLVAGCHDSRQERATELLQRTWEQISADQLDEALSSADEAVEVAPRSHYSWWALGSARLARKEYPEAEKAFREGLRIDQNEAALHRGLADALTMQGDAEGAIEELRRVLRATPGDDEARLKLGLLLLNVGEWEEAEALSRHVLEDDHSSAVAHYILGYALDAVGRSEEAEAELRASISLDSDYAESHAALALVLLRAGNLDEAELEARHAIELDGLASPHLTLARVLQRRGDYSEALDHLRRAERIGPHQAWSHHYRASVYQELGELDEALRQHERAVELAPDNSGMTLSYARVLLQVGRVEDAADQYRRAAALDPPDRETVAKVVRSLVNIGYVDQAITLIQELMGEAPSDMAPFLSRFLVVALLANGDTEDASQLLSEAPLDRDTLDACLARFSYFVSVGQWEEAWDSYSSAEAQAERPPVLHMKALALALSGRLQKAETAAMEARDSPGADKHIASATIAYIHAARGNDAEARAAVGELRDAVDWAYASIELLYPIGLAYRELGDTEEASKLFQRAIDRWPKHPWSEEMREIMAEDDKD